jgi:hypothetical protein
MVEPQPLLNIGFEMTEFAVKQLEGLDDQDPPPLLGSLESFKEFATSTQSTLAVLQHRYNYKQVSSNNQCKREGHLYQIRLKVGRIDYRALFTIFRGERKALWLDFFVKDPKNQARWIRRACDTAVTYHRGK